MVVGGQSVVRRLEGRWWRAEATPEREVRARLELAGSIAVLAVLAFACAHGSHDPNANYVNQADADKTRHFMVFPVNLTIKTAPEFSPALDDIFGAESFLFNIGNISGVQNILTDYHLLQSYRKFSQRILGNEGTWEFKVERGEANSNAGVGKNYGGTIKLFPVPIALSADSIILIPLLFGTFAIPVISTPM